MSFKSTFDVQQNPKVLWNPQEQEKILDAHNKSFMIQEKVNQIVSQIALESTFSGKFPEISKYILTYIPYNSPAMDLSSEHHLDRLINSLKQEDMPLTPAYIRQLITTFKPILESDKGKIIELEVRDINRLQDFFSLFKTFIETHKETLQSPSFFDEFKVLFSQSELKSSAPITLLEKTIIDLEDINCLLSNLFHKSMCEALDPYTEIMPNAIKSIALISHILCGKPKKNSLGDNPFLVGYLYMKRIEQEVTYESIKNFIEEEDFSENTIKKMDDYRSINAKYIKAAEIDESSKYEVAKKIINKQLDVPQYILLDAYVVSSKKSTEFSLYFKNLAVALSDNIHSFGTKPKPKEKEKEIDACIIS